jgi:hypothetical protein
MTPNQDSSVYLALANLYVVGECVLDISIRNAIVEHVITFGSAVNRGFPS